MAQFEQDQQGDNDIECLASQCDNPCVLGAGTSHLIHTKQHPEPLQVRCVLPSLSMEKSEVEMASVHAGVSPPPRAVCNEAADTAGRFPMCSGLGLHSTMVPNAEPNLIVVHLPLELAALAACPPAL